MSVVMYLISTENIKQFVISGKINHISLRLTSTENYTINDFTTLRSLGLAGRTRSSSALLSSTSRPESPKLDLALPSSPGRDVTEEVPTPRRVRNESYNTDSSLVGLWYRQTEMQTNADRPKETN